MVPVSVTLRRHLCIMLILCFLCPIPAAVFAESPTKTVIILKQAGSAHDIFTKNVRAAFRVEVVTEKQDKRKGLSGRDSLPADAGMLFVLEPDDSRFFWMKDMNFAIDIIVFDRDRKVVEILKGLQPCNECPIYRVPESAAYALEIVAGMAARYGIEPGDYLVMKE
ncbi:MAG TPA: DUF192 domain-containing protein [Thermodesulfovibrionales bacterium]|nr:DUF192 domain-containing protein [Thermodesulfovibrionales bacterium]